MRVIILVLCCFIAFLSNADAGEMYNCIDRDGNSIFTDTPAEGMKCVLKDSSVNASLRQQVETEHIKERKTIKKEIMTSASVETINGTWVFDAKATEELVVGSPQYHGAHEAAEHFGLGGAFLCAMMYEFNGDTATTWPLGARGTERVTELRLLSRQGREMQYLVNENTTKTKGSKRSILTVIVLNSNNIKIVYSGQEDVDFLLWKRIKPDEKLDSDLLKSWMPSIVKIGEVLNAKTEDGNQDREKGRHPKIHHHKTYRELQLNQSR